MDPKAMAGQPNEPAPRSRATRFAWLPIPLLLAAIIAARFMWTDGKHSHEVLRLLLSSTFYTLVAVGTLVLLARSFLVSGSPGLLLLECGVVLWALAGTVGDFVYHGVTNVNVTIFNTAILLAAACHLAGAVLSMKPGRALGRRTLWMSAAVAGSVAALGAITWATLTERMPVFFVPGHGPGTGTTPVRYAALSSAIIMFLISALLLNVRKRTRFVRWYSFALLSMTVGLFGIMIQTDMGTLVNWLARAAQWLGGLYLLASAVAAVRETGRWEISLDREAWDDRVLRAISPYLLLSLPTAWRYALAVLAVVAAMALRWALVPWLGTDTPYNIAFLTVLGTAIFLGTGPALLTVVLSVAAVETLVAPSSSPGRAAVTLVLGFLICGILHAVRAAARRAEESEARYRSLFSNMTEGFALHEIILDAGGVPVDYRFLDINSAFERLTGLRRSDLIGRTVREVLPGTESHWIDAYGRVALTGEPTHFEDEHASLGRRYEVFAYRPAPMQFAVVFMDITERKRAEEQLAYLASFPGLNPNPIAEIDLEEGSVRFANAAAERLFPDLAARGAEHPWLAGAREKAGEISADSPLVREVALGEATWHQALSLTPDRRRLRVYGTDITKRKRAEDALRESEERFRTLTETSSLGVGVASLDGKFLYFNKAYEGLFGWSLEELRDVNASNLWVEPLRRAEVVAAVREHGAVRGYEAELRRKDGTSFWADLTINPVNYGGVKAVMASVIDITDRKQAEAALRRSWQTFSELVERSPFGTYIVDARFRVAMMNVSSQKGAFRNVRPVIGRPIEEAMRVLWPEPVAAEICARFHHTLDTGESYHSPRFVNPRADAEIVESYEWELHRMTLPDGQHGVICYYYDSTALRQAEAALLRAKEELERRVAERTIELRTASEVIKTERQRFEDVLNMLPAYVILLSPDYRVPFANRFFEERFGKSDGRRCYEYLFGRTAPCENCETFKVLQTNAPHHWEWTGPDSRQYDISDFPFTDVDGSPLIMEVGLDITERRRAEAEVERRSGQLADTVVQLEAQVEQRLRVERDLRGTTEQLRKLASDLTLAEQRERHRLAQVLHDHLQQLLAVAKFRVSLLGHSEHVAAMEDREVIRVAHDVKAILDQSIDASRSLTVELSPPILHGGGLVQALRWLARNMKERHGLAVEVEATDHPADETEDVTVLLFQAVRELLFNTVKHAGVREACVRVNRVDGQVRIVVSDEGAGFDPATLRFDENASGGFGLFAVRERINLLGGSMDVESSPGKGCRFTLLAPVRKAEGAAEPEETAPVPAPARPASARAPRDGGRRIRVLVVDDHPVMREGLILLLKEAGDVEVVGEAPDGRTAVDAARRLRPDVVLMDINMPEMNGIEATRLIRAETPGVAVIGLSMSEEPEKNAAMREAGASAYLSKSGATDTLLGAIRSCALPAREENGPRQAGPAR